MNWLEIGLFSVAALVLLGSPGPGIAALVAVGRALGFAGGLRFYWGLQLGLALAAALSAAGLLSIIRAIPFAAVSLTTTATVYLVWLAYKIAAAPVGSDPIERRTAIVSSGWGGFGLGVTNPKAYAAFVSIMAAYPIVGFNSTADLAVKWSICVVMMMGVDIAWLWVGVVLGKARLRPGPERALNILMGATIIATALVALR
jgi:threonine/homoserine/homoserine lactone efflux protein